MNQKRGNKIPLILKTSTKIPHTINYNNKTWEITFHGYGCVYAGLKTHDGAPLWAIKFYPSFEVIPNQTIIVHDISERAY